MESALISTNDFDYLNQQHEAFEANLVAHADAPLLRTIRINQIRKKEQELLKVIWELKQKYRFAEQEWAENVIELIQTNTEDGNQDQ